jgi:hypothetical protein
MLAAEPPGAAAIIGETGSTGVATVDFTEGDTVAFTVGLAVGTAPLGAPLGAPLSSCAVFGAATPPALAARADKISLSANDKPSTGISGTAGGSKLGADVIGVADCPKIGATEWRLVGLAVGRAFPFRSNSRFISSLSPSVFDADLKLRLSVTPED